MSPPYRPDPTDALELLDGFAETVEEAYRPDLPAEMLARILVAIRDERAGLATLADRVTKDLLAEMPDRTLTVPEVGTFSARVAKRRRKWDNHELYKRVVGRARDERRLDQTTGEYENEADAVARILEECARPSWRLEPLRALGIDPDEWCEVDEAAWSIQLPGHDL